MKLLAEGLEVYLKRLKHRSFRMHFAQFIKRTTSCSPCKWCSSRNHVHESVKIMHDLHKVILSRVCSTDNFLITYITFVSLKFRASYITAQWNQFKLKNATYMYFLGICYIFHQKLSVFIIFICFFDKNQISAKEY